MENLFSYEGKRCLFTGCFSGMGEATARIIESLGGTIVAADIKQPTSFSYERYLEVDLRDAGAIEQMVAEVSAAGTIDRLFYCAGLPGTFPTLDVMLVNFVGLKHTVETVAPHMPRDGAIASISSSAGMGYPGQMEAVLPLVTASGHAEGRQWVEEHADEFDAYSFSKMCTIVYTLRRAATLTAETGVRLNCTSPGPTDTPMMPAFEEQAGKKFMAAYPKPIGRNSTAEEQGWPLAFLNSAAASYVSGENFFTDGGGAAGMMTGQLAMDFSLIGKN
ncbi:MAG: SDR family oxidoreductase [Deltaproteobacteria bacterium]|nr:SDR family oxidoreductase [Deltaproteobacteria bacterium]MBW2395991.1 SDR family oxidoreductase [Deltaproteobacteria bacterium]